MGRKTGKASEPTAEGNTWGAPAPWPTLWDLLSCGGNSSSHGLLPFTLLKYRWGKGRFVVVRT